MEEIETEEAKEVFDEHHKKYSTWYVVPAMLFCVAGIAALVLFFMGETKPILTLLIITAVSFVFIFIGTSIYTSLMKPYWKLLKIARLNDRLRHEERIRDKERRRLAEMTESKKYTTKDIDATMPDPEPNSDTNK